MVDEVNVVLKGSVEGFDRIQSEISKLRGQMENAGLDVSQFSKRLDAMERTAHNAGKSIKNAGAESKQAAASAKGWAESLTTVWARQFREAEKAEAAIRKVKAAQDQAAGSARVAGNLGGLPANSGAPRVGSSFGNIVDQDAKAAAQASRAYSNLSTQMDEAIEARKQLSAAFASGIQARMQEEVRATQEQARATDAAAAATARRTKAEADLNRTRGRRENASAAANWDAEFKSLSKLAAAQQDVINPSTRYALYDVSNAYRNLGLAMSGAAIYAVVVGAKFEAAFTNVERTLQTGTTAEEIQQIRSSLVQLSGQIPLTFQELSSIATIGNQMGIAKDSIIDFTGTIARFSQVAGISIEETTKSFGGFMAQTNLAPKYLENLGAAIAKVGIESNATEEQILSLMREIAAGATSAGFTADQIVGLAGTLASLQIAPERARGTLTTYFETLNKAVAGGGEKLENFSIITGIAADELSRMVNAGEGADVFRAFLQGIKDTGGTVQATQALDALGLSQLRVSDSVRRLSNGLKLYDRDQLNANSAFMEGAELSRQYAMTMDDLSSQWQIFINGINGLVEAISGGAVPTIADLLANINNVIFALTEFLGRNQWVAGALAITAAIVGVIGTMLIFRSLLLAGTAATYAMRTAIAQMGGAALASAGTVRGLAGALFGIRGAAGAAATGIFTLRGALRSLLASTGIGLLIAGAGFVADNLMGTSDAAQSAAIGLDEYNSAVKKSKAAMQETGEEADEFAGGGGGGGGLGGVGDAAEETAKKVRTLVDYVSDLSGVFKRSGDLTFNSGSAMDEITLKWIELNEQAEEYQRTIRTLTADRKLKQYWLDIANLYDDQIRASQLREEIAKIDDDMAEAQAGANTELVGNSRAAIENRKKMRELVGGYEEYIEALAAAGYSQEQIQAIITQLNGDFTAQATALGYSGAELGVYQDRFRQLSTIIDRMPRDVTVEFNGDPALQALNEFFAKAEEAARQSGANAGSGFGDGFGDRLGASLEETDTYSMGDKRGRDMSRGVKDGASAALESMGFMWHEEIANFMVDALGPAGVEAGAGFAFWFIDEIVRSIPVIGPGLADQLLGTTTGPMKTTGEKLGGNATDGFRASITTGFANTDAVGEWGRRQSTNAYNSGVTVGWQVGGGISAGIAASLGGRQVGVKFERPPGLSTGGYVDAFSGGGYTGPGHWLKPAGIVHAGEYVVPKKHVNQRTGLPDPSYVSSLQRSRSAPRGGYAMGGHVGGGFGGPVELGPATIGALINGMSVRLNVGREQLAQATSGGNKRLAFQGSN